jgi:hypothetical protein
MHISLSCEIIEQPKSITEPSDDTKDGTPDFSLPTIRIISEVNEPIQETNSTEEDTGDEAFCQRHFCRELLERKRYLFPDKNKNLPASPAELPPEFFISVLADNPGGRRRRKAIDLEKFKTKFEKIKSRYLSQLKDFKKWEELVHLANDMDLQEDLVLEEEEIDDECEYFDDYWNTDSDDGQSIVERSVICWEIVRKAPLLDEQGRERNIVNLRRVQPSVVE